MTARALKLEDFGVQPHLFVPELIDGSQLEEERLAAFDRGYAAGWDDSCKAAESRAADSQDALRARLQDLGFTFHEARAHVMQAMQPMLEAIMRHAVPKVLAATLGRRLVAEFEEMMRGTSDADIALLVAPGETPMVDEALADITALPIIIEEDPAIEPGQFHLRLGAKEREIDLNELGTRLEDALSALAAINKDTLSHG